MLFYVQGPHSIEYARTVTFLAKGVEGDKIASEEPLGGVC